MPFQLSPGVAVVEKDFTSIVPAVASSTGAFAGTFQWGPVLSPVTINSENNLVQRFGKPVDANAQSFFTAANFLNYTNNMLVTRVDTDNHRNAVTTTSGSITSHTFTNAGTGYRAVPAVTISAPNIVGGQQATAVATVTGGSVTAATVGNGGSAYTSATITFSAPQVTLGGSTATGTATIVSGVITGITITSGGSGYTSPPTMTITSSSGSGATAGVVTITGSAIQGLTWTNRGTGYTSVPTITIGTPASTGGSGTTATVTAAITVGGVKINNIDDYQANWIDGEGVVGQFAAKCPGTLGNSVTVSTCDSSASFAIWEYAQSFDSAPGTSSYATSVSGVNDEMHIIVIDNDGRWTGTPGSILEKFAYVSKASDGTKSDGTNNYYKDVINSRSQYIWWTDHHASGTNWGTTAANKTYAQVGTVELPLSGGVDDLTATDGQLMNAWNLYADDQAYDISLLPIGKASPTVANYVIALVESRKDCIAFISPEDKTTGDILISGPGQASVTDDIIAYRNMLSSSSYAVCDSGYKYQYDRYNDKYRWVPFNGDVAGLCARTDYTNDPWWSPGGLNRGQIKNCLKTATQLPKTDRDNLYKAGINPCVMFPGEGTILFGDKTLLSKPSAFDRINVRRLFIVLEKAIATAAKYQLFEFNDGFTRAQFKNLVEPFLRDVQGRRGITDFVVKCDDSNNTGEVIDRNEFVADIFIKPARSINFITLNFVAARSGINFSEIGG
jgi:phage tail sheath protein FI